MNIIYCKDSDIEELKEGSALTFEGTCIDDDNLEWLMKWFEEHDCKMLRDDFYVIKGKQMNDKYGLTGNNRYNDDLNILCVKLSDLSQINNIIMPRFEIGGRWLDDVIDNNLYREKI